MIPRLLLLLLLTGIPIAYCDIRWLVIPHILVFPGIILGAGYRILTGISDFPVVALELSVSLLIGLACYAAAQGGLGFGDILLALMVTAHAGLKNAFTALWIAVPAAAAVALLLLALGCIDRRTPLPWAPFYLAGSCFVMLC
ncbi:prepilin peptidase [Spirochaeta africana]|uniref:Type IV leader peptidase n=1 Tax=Spirochaeta africana (strain ATCC 700263 / DSM 8902 / Z-7692) TaxID=889378 RepID=H9UK55_SPIAZ|nr:prepilin peptidase [Spirochaeta africana]AFG37898.1 type IV leader peptidase [Spirochaeta africana DSM 8902]